METLILSKEKVKPSTPTPPHLRNHKQCFFDQLVGGSIRVVLFYKTALVENHNHLKNALSEILTLFYPLAGELTKGSTFVHCNDNGVLYVEARVNAHLDKFFETLDDLSQLKKLIPVVESHEGGTLASLQVTRFNCGAMSIGGVFDHKVLDATTMNAFLKTWAKTTRGDNREEKISMDFTSSARLFPAQNHFPQGFVTNSSSTKEELLHRRFLFGAKAIAAIKTKAASEIMPNPTRIEALIAFIWKHLMSAKRAVREKREIEPGLNSKSASDSTICSLTCSVNLRPRLDPPLPNSFGNLSWAPFAGHKLSELSETGELSHLAGKVRELFESAKGEKVKALEGDGLFTQLMNLARDYINISTPPRVDSYNFTSWCRLGLKDIDFGWGKPIWITPIMDPNSPLSYEIVRIVESGLWNNDGVEAWILRNKEEILELENDEEFMQYASPNPTIIIP